MKKVLTTLLTAALAAGIAITVSAAEPTILWDFGSDEDISEVMSAETNMMSYGEDDYYVFMATGADMYVTMNTPADNVSSVQWAKVRVQNPSTATAIELFGATNGRALSGPECTHINIEAECDEWKTYIINVFESNMITANTYKDQSLDTTYWMGSVDSIRLDPMWKLGADGNTDGGMDPGDEIHIDYIAFFETEADAIAFRSEQDSASTVVEQYRTEEAVVPADTSISAEIDTSSPDPTIVWNFGADAAMDALMSNPSTLEWTAEEDYYVFTATGADPNVTINTPADDARLVQWAKVRIKNPGPATALELFGGTNWRSLSGPECTHIDIESNSDEWKTYVVHIPEANVETVNTYKDTTLETTYWEGSVQFIRLDPMWQLGADGNADGSMTSGDQIYIDYIAFFANEEAANAYDPNAVAEEPVAEEPAAEEAVAEEAVAEEPAAEEVVVEEPVVEEVVEVVEAPAAAPQTFDIAAVLAVITGVLGMGLTAVSKKR